MPRRRRRSRKGSRSTCYYKVRGRYVTASQKRKLKKRKSRRRTRRSRR